MKGILYLLIAYLVGMGLSLLIGGFVPGSVMGMVVLFVALKTKIIKAEDVRATAQFLLDNMLLFFIPVCVGLMSSYHIIGDNWLCISVVLVVSTFLVLAVVGLIQQKMGKSGKKEGVRDEK